MPVLAINAIPPNLLSLLPALTTTDVLGLSLFIGGLGFEIAADRQKRAWARAKQRKEHDEAFLARGLWSRSRHPNYFGECTLWTGIAVAAAGVLAGSAGQLGLGLGGTVYGRLFGVGLCAVSPAFVTFLLFQVSGIPLSEGKYDAKYGTRKDYQEWKKNTPVFIPKF